MNIDSYGGGVVLGAVAILGALVLAAFASKPRTQWHDPAVVVEEPQIAEHGWSSEVWMLQEGTDGGSRLYKRLGSLRQAPDELGTGRGVYSSGNAWGWTPPHKLETGSAQALAEAIMAIEAGGASAVHREHWVAWANREASGEKDWMLAAAWLFGGVGALLTAVSLVLIVQEARKTGSLAAAARAGMAEEGSRKPGNAGRAAA